MPEKSPFQIDIPATDVLSYLFPPGTTPSDKPIWIDAVETEHSLSPRQLLQWAKRLGLGLHGLGLQEGDVVMVYSHNHIFVPVAYLGISGSGFIFSGTNPAYTIDETVFQIQNTGCKAILVEPSLLSTVLKASTKTSFPQDKIYLFSDKSAQTTNGIRDWRTLVGSVEAAEKWQRKRLSKEQSQSTVAALNYSSGTTGLPKGVMISHQNVIANVEQSIYMRDLEQPYHPSNRPEERWLGFLPLYHAYGQLWSIVAACRLLTPCFFMRQFSYTKFLEHIQNHKVTHIQTAPPVLVMLAKRPETSKYDLSSLKNILCGAAPLSKELQNDVSDRFKLKVVQTWGMTEVTCSSLHVPGGLDDRSGSVGYIDPNAMMKLIDEDGKEVGIGERGEVHVKGPNVCLGYWRNEKATRETFDEDGFLRTGDVAIRDHKGWYWIVDRKKELIKVSGFQVAPAELEALLLEHDHVADAAVVALQFEHEELPRAYCVIKDEHNGKSTEWDIERWMAARVAKHKHLSGGVVFIPEVPKSPSGKIQRKVLRDWATRDAKNHKPKARL
ncbi:4-coumarate-CoA ligase [Mytilinidion resinicola]|uniref:4-coumarate-CoA ligase n=1 Tax=Mytilinidion resinicola TaxID=574789 RepID=A0A6A6Z5P2_9PEZI|nr:4-coumarate-CoA ligase [Mytilinidion resinicola]KAF2816350.1 4-coumarate-CoA ligase [Mytilinidion resinicola]